jgi:hypothetical protein
MPRHLSALCALFFILLSPAPAAAQRPAERTPSVRTTTTEIRLDGRLDEPDWALADSIWEFRQKEPVEGAEPSERTVVRLLATPAGLAIGWWLYDRDPAHLVRTQLRRDATLRSDDYVSMMIDGLSDRRSAFFFRVNSNGALWDGEHVTQEAGNEEWDGVWDARTQINAEGWTAEILIPWATLRYPRDVASMSMNFRRFLPRKNEEILWRAWRRSEGLRFLEKGGAITGFSDLPRRARAEVRPFVVGQASPAERLFATDGSSTVTAPARTTGAAGLDAKVPLTNTLTLDLTVLPDFAQADVDLQVVNLSRFPLFFPERRPFFTEGASVFAFGREEQTQLFYSRRIGLGAGGAPVDIPFGARVQGRAGAYQLGLLASATSNGEDGRHLVARTRRDVLGRGYVGAMGTYSDQTERPGALAGGLDFNLPWSVGDESNLILLGNAAWSRDSVGGASGAHYRVVLDYPNDHADLVMRYDLVEAGFDPSLGFVVQRGIHRLGGSTAITPRPRAPGIVRRWEFNLLSYNAVWDLDGRLDNALFMVRPLGAQFQSGDRLELNFFRLLDAPLADFDLVPGTTIAAGEYWWNRAEIKYDGSNVRAWQVDAEVSVGPYYTGNRLDTQIAVLGRIQPHYELTLELERNEAQLPEGDFITNVARFRGDYALNPRLTLTGFVQYDDLSDRAALNARLRWTRSPGSDLYVVWNSVWPVEPARAFVATRPQQGALVVKYTQYLRF